MIITNDDITIHSAGIHEIHDVPIEVITRPIKIALENQRLESMIDSLKDSEAEKYIAPIDVFWIEGSEGGNYFFCFNGDYRYEAHRLLGRTTIRAKLIKSSLRDLKTHLGGSTPEYLK